MRYFEDLAVGETLELGSVAVTEDEIVEFATRYDPQPFHIDRAAAGRSVFGGLIASGWHTCSLYMRLLATGLLNDTPSLGSPGVDEIRWDVPVRPGDTLTGSVTLLEARTSRSRPDRGIVKSRGELRNQDGATALRIVAISLIGRRPG
ncbi:MAG TPA: MaoC family dehydratase [Egibacteraceae bacterium]|nr:MaoC family dehydratase [Egibacteraceae bacterium]